MGEKPPSLIIILVFSPPSEDLNKFFTPRKMFVIRLIFYEDLVDFFSKTTKKRVSKVIGCERRSVKDLIESLGVPHTELGQILVDGNSVDYSYIVEEKCKIEVYPFRISGFSILDFPLNEKFRFLCDVHLGTLAKKLRLLGLDTVYNKKWPDEKLAEISIIEGRFLLTRDRHLLMRKRLTKGLYIRSTVPEKQVFEVVNRLDLKSKSKPFSRCLVCNGILRPIKNNESVFKKGEEKIPPKVKKWCKEFSLCGSCHKIYWKGSHFEKLKEMVDSYLG